jgi:hypothetical protein
MSFVYINLYRRVIRFSKCSLYRNVRRDVTKSYKMKKTNSVMICRFPLLTVWADTLNSCNPRFSAMIWFLWNAVEASWIILVWRYKKSYDKLVGRPVIYKWPTDTIRSSLNYYRSTWLFLVVWLTVPTDLTRIIQEASTAFQRNQIISNMLS